MAKPRFKDPAQQALYELWRANPVSNSRGSGTSSAYHNGLAGQRSRYVVTSFAHAAWAAGQDAYKAKQREERAKAGPLLCR